LKNKIKILFEGSKKDILYIKNKGILISTIERVILLKK